MQTFDVPACAEFLKVHRTTVLKLAATGELPGAKIGRAWVFLECDLVAYVRNLIQSQQEKRQAQLNKSPVTNIKDMDTIALQPISHPRNKRRPLPQLSS